MEPDGIAEGGRKVEIGLCPSPDQVREGWRAGNTVGVSMKAERGERQRPESLG